MAPYNQTVIGTTTLTSQAFEFSRTLRTQSHQPASAAEVIEDRYRLLLSLQSTTQHLAEAAPTPEYTKAVSRNRHWVLKYEEFLDRQPGHVWAFAGPAMPRFTVSTSHDITPSAPVTLGQPFLREKYEFPFK